RKPDLPGYDERILTKCAQSTVLADRDRQLFLAGWVILHRNTRPFFLWDFVASSPGGRRIDCHLNGLDAAKAGWRRRAEGSGAEYSAEGPVPQGVLSVDLAPHSGTWIDFRGYHTGRECRAPPWA